MSATSPQANDGHIVVCVRIRDVPTVHAAANELFVPPASATPLSATPRMGGRRTSSTPPPGTPNTAVNNPTSSAAGAPPLFPTAAGVVDTTICVSALENVVVMHDPRTIHDPSSVAKDASTLIQALQSRSSEQGGGGGALPVSSRCLTSTAAVLGGAAYFECDECIVSMDTESARQMPIVRDSDFLQPPPYGKQEDVYQCTAAKAVTAALEGIHSCVFAYGQTGSGKTYTLFGDTSSLSRDPGIVPRALDDLFHKLETRKRDVESDPAQSTTVEYSFRVSLAFFEIYQSDVTCLLSKKGPLKVVVGDSAPIIQDLEVRSVTSVSQALSFVDVGLRRRQTGETGMNAKSSRSHAIVQVTVQQFRTNKRTRETVEFTSIINLVDLAGSERQRTAKTEGKSRTEGIQINQSLATLARVIHQISRNEKHIAYRDSMLTTILRENLGGNSRTFMIATINPTIHAFHESTATLQYARDVRKIRNRPKVNKTFQTRGHLQDINKTLKDENELLRQQVEELLSLERARAANGNTVGDGAAEAESNGPRDEATFCAGEPGKRPPQRELTWMAPSDATKPLLVSVTRVHRTAGAVPTTHADGRIRITPIEGTETTLDLSTLLHTWTGGAGAHLLQFECVEQRGGVERSFWLRKSSVAAQQRTTGDAQQAIAVSVNGRTIGDDDPHPLTHGDVVTTTVDDPVSRAQEILSLHFVDLAAEAPRDGAAKQQQRNVGVAAAALPSTESPQGALSPDGKSNRILYLEKELSKLLDIIAQQSRTIEYQCQRENARAAAVGPPPPPPPLLRTQGHEEERHPTSVGSQDAAGVASLSSRSVSSTASVATVASPDVRRRDEPSTERFHAIALQATFDAAAATSLARLDSPSPATASVSRDSGAVVVTALNLSRQCSAARAADDASLVSRYEACMDENRALQLRLAECQETIRTMELDYAALQLRMDRVEELRPQGGATPRGASTTTTTALSSAASPTPAESPYPRPASAGPRRLPLFEGEPTAAELRERLLATRREKALREQLSKLEAMNEELQQQVRSCERMLEDSAAEHSIILHECQNEAAELSRALLSSTAEFDNAVSQLQSLEELARRAEDAVTEVGVQAEAELERRLALMNLEKRSLSALCKWWKRTALQDRLASKSSGAVTSITEDGQRAVAATAQHMRRSRGGADDALIEQALQVVHEVDSDSNTELVDVLKTNLKELEDQKALLRDRLETLSLTLDEQRARIAELEDEKQRLEREKGSLDERVRAKAIAASKKKSEELSAAEKLKDELSSKLEMALQSKQKLHQRLQSVTDMLKEEQRRNQQKLAEEITRLEGVVTQRDEEIAALRCLQQLGGVSDRNQLPAAKQKLEAMLEAAHEKQSGVAARGGAHIPSSLFQRTAHVFPATSLVDQYTAFPRHFNFSEEIVTMTRVCLRMLMDQLKVDLYVMNKAAVQAIGSILPTVQYRPDAVFQGCMTDLRRVVCAAAKSAQKIGCRWTMPDDVDLALVLSDTDKRLVHRALLGLLLWYDHWDMVAKKDHASFIELVRNSDLLSSMARTARAESHTPTNSIYSGLAEGFQKQQGESTSSSVTGTRKTVASEMMVQPSVVEGRRIVAAFQRTQNASVLVQRLRSPIKKGAEGAAAPVSARDELQPLTDRSSGSNDTARHAVHERSVSPQVAMQQLPQRRAVVQPLTETDVDMAVKFSRQQSAAVFPARVDDTDFGSGAAPIKRRSSSAGRGVSGASPPFAVRDGVGTVDPQIAAEAAEIKKKMSAYSEKEVMELVMKEKHAIFGGKHRSKGSKHGAGVEGTSKVSTAKTDAQAALLAFFRTVSPQKNKLMQTVASPQQPVDTALLEKRLDSTSRDGAVERHPACVTTSTTTAVPPPVIMPKLHLSKLKP